MGRESADATSAAACVVRLKHSEPAADELLEVRGYGQLLPGVEGLSPLEQRPADLEGEEEIAPGYAAHALQGPA